MPTHLIHGFVFYCIITGLNRFARGFSIVLLLIIPKVSEKIPGGEIV